MEPIEQPETEQPAAGGGLEELRHELMVTKASERYNAEYARTFELERNKALAELAYVRLQRDKLLEITWLDLPGEPDESTARWRELFEAGWVRRVEAAAEQGGATNHSRDKQFAPAHGSAALWWTAEKPAAAGWWWVMSTDYEPRIMLFVTDRYFPDSHPIQPFDGPLSTEGWKWFAGPLPEPLEASDEATPPNIQDQVRRESVPQPEKP